MARGMGRVEWGWRAECCRGPARGQSAGPRDSHTHLVITGCVGSMARILLLGVWAGQRLGIQKGCPVPQPSLQRGKLFFPIPAPAAAACLTVPVPQVATACTSCQGTQRTFFGKVCIWKRVQALPDAPYLHTDAHPTPAVPWLFEMPTPAGHRSALRPAQIYPLFYIHTPLIFTALLEQYPGLLITPGPPPPPMCIHHAPTKVPSVSWG